MSEFLEACPFCSGSASVMQNYLNQYFVICNECYARTDAKRFKKDAVALWNNRRNKKGGNENDRKRST